MFKFLLRKTVLRKLNKEDQDIALMLKDEIRLSMCCFFILMVVVLMPCIILLTMCFLVEDTVLNAIYIIFTFFTYYGFIAYLIFKFSDEISTFLELIKSKLFFTKYTVKGNAILKEDFEKIRKEKNNVYDDLRYRTCRGYCYSTCFSILKCLQKGEIKFIAIKYFDFEKETDHYYTVHVIYVKDGWCFDTYSCKQFKVEYYMKHVKGIDYRSFNYEDIKDFEYDDFRKTYSPKLKDWCEKNNCHEEWSKFEQKSNREKPQANCLPGVFRLFNMISEIYICALKRFFSE